MTEIYPPRSAMGVGLPHEGEFELLRAVVGAKISAEQIEMIGQWNLSRVDWVEFQRLAEYHGVLPLAARNLMEHGRGLPVEIQRSLRSAYEANLRRSLWFSAELSRISRHFEGKNLRAVPYKGPVLAEAVYRDPGLRSYSDLDLLIIPDDFARAKQALTELGYRPTSDQSAAIERLWIWAGYERSFDGLAGKNLVELQWALLPYFYGVDVRVEELAARAGRISIAGCEVACLSPEDCVIVLCLHAAKHLWTRLIWLSDIAEAASLESVNWALVTAQAEALGVVRMLGVSFWLTKNILRSKLPAAAEEIVGGDARVSAIGAEFAERLRRGDTYNFESTEYFRLILKLRERRSDQLRYLWRLVWTPGPGDVAAVQLPQVLFPLYRMVRLGRLLRKILVGANS
ncbi:MAG: nucleotidyltransferase family protein [Terriglobales bacterium]|jgi:hypothetical protein